MKHAIIAVVLAAGFAYGQAPNAAEPEDLRRLRESWQRAREQVDAPLDRKYADALVELMAKLVKAGNLQAAVLVDTEIKKVSPDRGKSGASVAGSAKMPDVKWYVGRSWWTDGRQEFAFAEHGKGLRTTKSGAQAHFTWRLMPSGLVKVTEESTKPGAQGELWYFHFDSGTKATIGKSETSLPWVLTDK